MISVYLNGRLGNNLFQYIFCRIAAIKQKCNFYIPKNILESNYFYTFCNQKLKKYFEMPCESNPHYWIDNGLFNIDYGINDGNITSWMGDVDINNVTDGTLLVDFYQSDSYMLDYRDIIINDWLKFNESSIINSEKIVNKFSINEYCYIHLRGTDYKTIPHYYLPIDYYLKSINYVKTIKSNIKFLVITDDIEESKIMFPDFEAINNSIDVDFYLLSQAKYRIIPNSSFSWWASWLSQNNKITIAPNRWFNYNNKNMGFSPANIKTSLFTYI